MDMLEIFNIKKKNSINMLIEYKLYLSQTEGEKIYSVSIETAQDRAFAEDVCRDRKSAEDFLYLLAREEVEPCHLLDIVYDVLPI